MTDKERLEEIKKVAGLDYLIGGTKVEEHWDWLIKQAEKVERYEKVLAEVADSFAFDDVYDEVTTKRFIAKQVLQKHKS
ncbi:hypothetical protein [Metabacillus sp. Hm71]|uniref:hypothetical protein n=1 Tax=Metabacillus sp. Hm71 TaxID=3450743 RepID=UPI003F41C9C6